MYVTLLLQKCSVHSKGTLKLAAQSSAVDAGITAKD